MKIRAADVSDADAMSAILRENIELTGRVRPSDTAFVTSNYILHPDSLRCSIAIDEDGETLGFQSLLIARAGNPYGVAAGCGIIGTHVSPRAARKGVGTMLFEASRKAAQEAGLTMIDATIPRINDMGLGYYEAMGFRTYRESERSISKSYAIV